MFDNLGIEWAATLLGCLAACCVPIPVIFYLFGKKLRQKSKFAPTMAMKKPPTDEEESAGSSNEELPMAALHATRSRAHHDLDTGRHRAQSAGNGSAVLTGTATGGQDPEKTK
jgi:DHA1 family multidrug resistance protein-like MFS transporter